MECKTASLMVGAAFLRHGNVLLLAGVIFLAACGGGGSGGAAGGGSLPLFVDIEGAGATSVTAATVDLTGTAECDGCPPSAKNFGSCPAINAPQNSAIPLTWTNRTSGISGAASGAIVGVCGCLASWCMVSYAHRWSASVPLVIGDNTIQVRASRPSGESGLDSIAVTRLPTAALGLAAIPGQGQVTLRWDPADGAASYNLYFATTRDVTPTSGTKISGVVSPFTHAGLPDDATYYYVLTNTINGFESPASAVVWATPGWRTEAIAMTMPPTAERDVSIATGSAADVHVHQSYDAHTSTALFFANDYLTNVGGRWTSVPVAHASWVTAGLALGTSDTVHAAYLGSRGSTRVILNGAVWTADIADPAGWCSASLALGPDGNDNLAFYGGGDSIRYATNASGAWVTSNIESLGSAGCYGPGTVSLGIDPAGVAHVAYPGKFPGDGLRYATNRGGAWTVATLDAAYVRGQSLAVDANGKIHIVYTTNVGELKYAQDTTGDWAIEVLENGGGPNHAALALDAAGNAHISYIDGRFGELRYTTKDTDNWRVLSIDAADSDFGGHATDTAIAVDLDGKVHMVYYRNGALHYATNR